LTIDGSIPLIILRLFLIFVGLGVGLSILMAFVTQDKRYFRFAWQVFKFSVVLLLVFAALMVMGRIILL
jgi:hypothetical protein